jgi:Na+/H+ antiporter NhaD/arsenite permease-like protein
MTTAAIFILTYAVVAAGRVPGVPWLDRSRAAGLGAVLMIATGAIGVREAAAAIDATTIVLLLAMMLIVAPLQLSGVFARIVVAVSRRVEHPAALLGALVAAAGVLSAIFVNDTICVAFTPLVLELAALRRHRALPYLLALATASNIGSVATVVGNPQNMLIGSISRMNVVRFTAALAPVAVVGLAIDAGLLWLLFRSELVEHAADDAALPDSPPADGGRVTPGAVLRTVDWKLLLLFAGLFVVVGAAERQGIDRRLFTLVRPLGVATVAGLSATAVVLSNAISNVPAVMLFTQVVPKLPDPERAWLALAMSSTLAGNLTIVGSIANLIVIESARRRGVRVSLGQYLRVGVPLTVLTVGFGVWWIA